MYVLLYSISFPDLSCETPQWLLRQCCWHRDSSSHVHLQSCESFVLVTQLHSKLFEGGDNFWNILVCQIAHTDLAQSTYLSVCWGVRTKLEFWRKSRIVIGRAQWNSLFPKSFFIFCSVKSSSLLKTKIPVITLKKNSNHNWIYKYS